MVNSLSAATAIDLRHQSYSNLQTYFSSNLKTTTPRLMQLKQIRSDVDQNQTTHKRIQQTYAGFPVWHATAIIHTVKSGKKTATNATTMNGIIYEGLEKDLASTASFALDNTQKQKALAAAKLTYEQKTGRRGVRYQDEETKTIIFVDKDKQAHYAYLVSFYDDDHLTGAHRPTYIMNAETLRIYKKWDQVFTFDTQPVGGIGGNAKTGELVYDNATGNLPALNMLVFPEEIEILPGQKIKLDYCFFQNEDLEVQDVSYDSEVISVPCVQHANSHNNLLWVSNDANRSRWNNDAMNNGFSPSLDAFYAGTIVKKLYQDWYGVPALVQEDGTTPMKLVLRTHYGRNFDNAFWDGKQMTFGDGGNMFYPLTSLDVGAHEISHGFTAQHANLDGSSDQMGALHESFSDMATAAAEYYTTGKNTWKVGATISKNDNALRYLDNPTKDGQSLDNLRDFQEGMDPHLLAGVFNKAFYLIATTHGWNTRKAFDVMVKANMNYWTSSMETFKEAACGALSATQDLSYNVADVRVAFSRVGIETDNC
jgi:pseudolysin